MPIWQPRTTIPGQRLNLTLTTEPLLPGVAAAVELPGAGQLGHCIAASADAPAWISLYASAAARTADAGRLISADPSPGSGVLLDLAIAEAGETVLAAPGCTYFQADATTNPVLRALVRNTGSSTAAIAITLTVVVLVP